MTSTGSWVPLKLIIIAFSLRSKRTLRTNEIEEKVREQFEEIKQKVSEEKDDAVR